jgi:hypothetical protein
MSAFDLIASLASLSNLIASEYVVPKAASSYNES